MLVAVIAGVRHPDEQSRQWGRCLPLKLRTAGRERAYNEVLPHHPHLESGRSVVLELFRLQAHSVTLAENV